MVSQTLKDCVERAVVVWSGAVFCEWCMRDKELQSLAQKFLVLSSNGKGTHEVA